MKKALFLLGFGLSLFSVKQALAEDTMNGYSAGMFGDFASQWKLVTSRYRKDTGEMRLTYANPSAWETLLSGKTNYRDGAVFAKISYLTKDDPDFPSSAVPSGARRVQFMVRDQKKHVDADGWGYALFDSEGKTYPGDEKTATMACAACHRLVPHRGFVFSQPMLLSSFVEATAKKTWRNNLAFTLKNKKSLPDMVRKLLPQEAEQVKILEGELSKHVFMGTLDEIRPLLAQEVYRSKIPVVFVSQDKKLFSLVFPVKGKECRDKEMSLKGVHSSPDPHKPPYEIVFCQGSVT